MQDLAPISLRNSNSAPLVKLLRLRAWSHTAPCLKSHQGRHHVYEVVEHVPSFPPTSTIFSYLSMHQRKLFEPSLTIESQICKSVPGDLVQLCALTDPRNRVGIEVLCWGSPEIDRLSERSRVYELRG